MGRFVGVFGVLLFAFGVTAWGETPLRFWHDLPREVRYAPDGEDFVITNGTKRFTRAIYGTNTGFRFETSDFPEFGLYMPNLGGSVYLAISVGDKTVWIKDLGTIEALFRSGMRVYTITDKRLLGKGSLKISAVALSDADGFVVKVDPVGLPSNAKLLWIYGGANHQRFSREGDIGADPSDSFYIKPERCEGNVFDISGGNSFTIHYGKGVKSQSNDETYENPSALKSIKTEGETVVVPNAISGVFPIGTKLRLGDGNQINSLEQLISSKPSSRPVLIAECSLDNQPIYIETHNPKTTNTVSYNQLAERFQKGIEFREKIAGRIKISTPDPYINTLGGIFAGVEDAVWEDPGYLHGAIGWRIPLTGWRAAYLGDLVGMHDRARTHFNGYANAQITNIPVTKPHTQDTTLHLARAAKEWGTPMYSNGYICRNPNKPNAMHHYDMNLVFIDELLWHFNWTGDIDYVREVFPVIKRHLAWEKQLFDPDNDFLYDGYCCIWASDALQYNGGVATHSSAYNYRANRLAAELAAKIGEDPTPYKTEADGILAAINKTLWIENRGHWAEFKDNMGHKMVHPNAALWSIYHSIDSDIHDPFKAYQATRYIDTEIPHIPVLARGLGDTTNYVISTTNWQPYMWSINNVAFAETTHSALAYWQSGRSDEAFKMFKGSILDAMYLGSGPGNITQVSFYDAARGETYRDFADPAATGLRAIVHGMFGIIPDLMNERLTIRPGFPRDWNFASIETLNMGYDFKRKGSQDTYKFEPLLRVKPSLTLDLVARNEGVAFIKVNGKLVNYRVLGDAVGAPRIAIEAGTADKYEIVVEWAGHEISDKFISQTVAKGDGATIDIGNKINKLYDPQGILCGTAAEIDGNTLKATTIDGELGSRTIFANVTAENMTWWQPIDIEIVEPLEVINNAEDFRLRFELMNNSSKTISGTLYVNNRLGVKELVVAPFSKQSFVVAEDFAVFGTNEIRIETSNKQYKFKAINWNCPNGKETKYETVDFSFLFNDKVSNIFGYEKYLAPRWQYTTLQVPTQGMGEWCRPEDLSVIDDSGLRAAAGAGAANTFTTPDGIPFATPSDPNASNITFTTLWDNYPAAIPIPLTDKASHAYFMVAGSTYHMQSHIVNGTITVTYKDKTTDVLELIPPENFIPLDQDIFIDNAAFYSKEPRPYRVRLKTGSVSTNHAAELGKTISNNPIYVDGGMATIIDLPLDPSKELSHVTLETIANEVVIGLMSITLVR